MVRQLTKAEFASFVTEKHAAAVHFDADWDVAYRPITRKKMLEAEVAFSQQVNFGEVDCDREISLAKSIRLSGVPGVAYYLDGKLLTVLLGAKQNVSGRLQRMLHGEPIGHDDGLDGGR